MEIGGVTWESAFDWVIHNIAQIALVLSTIIQITPIKLNPWSALFKWIGKMINNETNKKIDAVATEQDQLKNQISSVVKAVDENEKDRIRWEVLEFANSCRNGRKHTRDEFQHIITLNDKYKALLAKTNDKNGVFDSEYEYIDKLYKERQEKNDFLA